MHQDKFVVDSRSRLKLECLLLAIQLKCAFINKSKLQKKKENYNNDKS